MAKCNGRTSSKASELLEYMTAALADILERCGIEKRKAGEVAVETLIRMQAEFGGQQLYFPIGGIQTLDEKANTIYDKFMKGAFVDELAAEFGHSIQWIYRLLAKVRARKKVEREAEREAERAKEYKRWRLEN